MSFYRLSDINWSVITTHQVELRNLVRENTEKLASLTTKSANNVREVREQRDFFLKTKKCKCCVCNYNPDWPCLCFGLDGVVCCHELEVYDHGNGGRAGRFGSMSASGGAIGAQSVGTVEKEKTSKVSGSGSRQVEEMEPDDRQGGVNLPNVVEAWSPGQMGKRQTKAIVGNFNTAIRATKEQRGSVTQLRDDIWQLHVDFSDMKTHLKEEQGCKCCCCHYMEGDCPCRHCRAGLSICCVFVYRQMPKFYNPFKENSSEKSSSSSAKGGSLPEKAGCTSQYGKK